MRPDLKQALLKHERLVPRYTSYPTAPHFYASVPYNWYEAQLAAIPAGSELSLYVHIPFCPKLCWFCGCNTRIVNRYGPVEDYLALLEHEFSIIWPHIREKNLKVSHLHFGGGSPTMLKSADFTAFIRMLKEHFDFEPAAEIAIEIDPRNVNKDKIKAYGSNHVNRLSFGIQDFDQKVMEAVNRPQTYELDKKVISMCRDQGIDHINIDMMYGLPFQTVETMRNGAEKALSLEPDRIALFGYAHVPWLKKHMRLLPEEKLPSAEERIDMFEEAAAIFEDAGYIPIGIDHFAKEDDSLTTALRQNQLNRNFQGYTDDNAPYLLALGASAISRLDSTYIQNEIYIPQYREKVRKDSLPVSKYYQSTPEDKLRGTIIKGLMCSLSVNPITEAQRLEMDHHDFDGCYENLHTLAHDGLIKVTGDGTVHVLMRQAARLAAACFDQKLEPSTVKHASST